MHPNSYQQGGSRSTPPPVNKQPPLAVLQKKSSNWDKHWNSHRIFEQLAWRPCSFRQVHPTIYLCTTMGNCKPQLMQSYNLGLHKKNNHHQQKEMKTGTRQGRLVNPYNYTLAHSGVYIANNHSNIFAKKKHNNRSIILSSFFMTFMRVSFMGLSNRTEV